MIAVVLAGAGVGVGLVLLAVALHPPVPSLAAQLAAYDAAARRPRPDPSGAPATGWRRVQAGAGDRLAVVWAEHGWLTGRLRADLAIVGRSAAAFLAAKVTGALAGLLVLPAAAAVLTVTGTGLPLLVPVWLAVTCGLVAFLVPDLRLRAAAGQRRRDFRAVVAAYLDHTALRMASGAGLAEALSDAARVGTGPAYARLRGALADARTDGVTAAAALGQLGAELGIGDLVDVAARLSLVDTAGAQAQTSLRAQAASLRERELSDIAGRAGERTQSMRVAQVVLGLGFLIFLMFPAVMKVMAF